ncbi:MAG: ABC transporter permease [Verrucomicrobia bacterium]|nr:ABC transporter permease [Verrucomicrobiota bacterium]
MRFLPVVERELRVASRRRATYWTRFTAASVAIGLYIWIWLAFGDNNPSSQLPVVLFGSLATFAYIYTLIAGVHVTADCLSEEKREGTLGLLFLTDLKGYDVVLGKLAATSLGAFYRLMAIVPVLAIPLILGGLTHDEFWRMVLVLTNTLFFSLCAGLFCSSISLQERKAILATLCLILGVTVGPPLIGYIDALRQTPFQLNTAYLTASSGYSFSAVFANPFKASPTSFWISVSLTHFFGWTFLILACICVRYTWQDKPSTRTQTRWRERWKQYQFGSAGIRARFRRSLLDINPFFWIAGRNRLRPAYVLATLGLAGCFWFWLYLKFPDDMTDSASFVPIALMLHTVLKMWVASEACRTLCEERKSGSIELVLSTPLSVDQIIRGQLLALNRQFGWPVILVLGVDFVMFLAGIKDRILDTSGEWTLTCLAVILMFVADIFTLAWVGMWLGLNARHSHRAARGAVFRVMVLPWLLFFALMTATVAINIGQSAQPENFAVITWFLIGMANNLFFYLSARDRLRQELRTIATERFKMDSSRRAPASSRPGA